MRRPSSIPELSVCLIARNEERFLAECLESVAPIADEIVLVDTGSDDRTIEIAESFGARVLTRPWTDDFAAARNHGIEAALGEWILCLDPDERLHGPRAVRSTIERAAPDVGGYVIERHDITRDPDSGRTVVHAVGIVRLFRRDPRIRYIGSVHERPGETVLEAGFGLATAGGTSLTHLVRASSEAELDSKQKYYLSLLDRELAKDPNEPWFRYYRGKTRWYLSHRSAALEDFGFVKESPRAYPFLRASALCMRGLLLAEMSRPEEALSEVAKSLEIFPRQSLAHYVAGEILYGQGRFAEAAHEYRQVRLALTAEIAVAPVHGDYYFTREKQAYKLGCCHLARGELDQARDAFDDGIAANEDDAGCYFGLANVALQKGEPDLALENVRKALEHDPGWREPVRLEREIQQRAPVARARAFQRTTS